MLKIGASFSGYEFVHFRLLSFERNMPVHATGPQNEFVANTAPLRCFVGARGSGKTYGIALAILQKAARSTGEYLCFGVDEAMLEHGLAKAVYDAAVELNVADTVKDWNWRDGLKLFNESEICFATPATAEAFLTTPWDGIAIDNADYFEAMIFWAAYGCRRPAAPLLLAFLPSSEKGHWTNKIFAFGNQLHAVIINASVGTNHFLDPSFIEALTAAIPEEIRKQVIEGHFPLKDANQ